MKFRLAALTLSMLAGHGAIHAQTQAGNSLQIYGQVTAGVTYRDHQTGATSRTDVSNNLFAASLLGFRGTESLGGGMSTVFRLESGFNTNEGTAASIAKLWNRQSFVGLNISPMMTVTIGRQFHAATDRAIQSLDVHNLGGTSLSVTPLGLFGVNRFATNDSRADNSIKLRLRGPVGLTAGLSAAANDSGSGRSYSFDVAQVTPAYTLAGYAVKFEAPTIAANGTRPTHLAWGLGGNAPVGPVTLYGHYMNSELDPSAVGRIQQKNKILILGANWRATPQTSFKAAYTHDKGTAMNGVSGRNGNKDTWVLSADYFLSKRTSLNAGVFNNRFSDGYKLDPTNIAALGRDAAASSTSGITAGMRHDF
jgi:predicted porin